MSKNAKTILIILGILAFLSITCVVGLGFLGYFFVDHAGVEKSEAEGSEFGKTTDNFGCQTKAISLAKPLNALDITQSLKTRYFFDKCLETSRPNTDFCKNVPSEWSEIINDHKWKEDECRKLGFNQTINCRTVLKARTEFCEKK